MLARFVASSSVSASDHSVSIWRLTRRVQFCPVKSFFLFGMFFEQNRTHNPGSGVPTLENSATSKRPLGASLPKSTSELAFLILASKPA